jgi:hypothetical protein
MILNTESLKLKVKIATITLCLSGSSEAKDANTWKRLSSTVKNLCLLKFFSINIKKMNSAM